MNASRSRAGDRFGPYELRSLIGRGGMGEVYEAYDTHNDRVVAVKLLPEELAQDPTYRERFRRESHAATRIDDPHIVQVNRAGEIDGMLYLDMRLIRGDNLRAMLRRQGPMEPSRAVHIVDQVAAALDAAHRSGLVHRDVKPANILVTPTDFTFLTDFGIARTEGDSSTTMVGITAGSYTYMAPERFDSGPITGRADTYSLACVLYECLTGATPFPVQNISNLIRSHLSETPPRPSIHRKDVPGALDAVIAHAMSKSPADRFASAGEFAGAARVAVGLSGSGAAETRSEAPFDGEPEQDRADGPAESDAAPPRLAAGPGAPRPVAEATTFQPFGPKGPTIAAQFQPRGDSSDPEPETADDQPLTDDQPLIDDVLPAAGSPTTVMRTPPTGDFPTTLVRRGPVPPGADDPTPDETITPVEPVATPRGYETTGSLRIIAPPNPEDRYPSADLPVITPGDPTHVRREEFGYEPLPQRKTPPAPPPPTQNPPLPTRSSTPPTQIPAAATPPLPTRSPNPPPQTSASPTRTLNLPPQSPASPSQPLDLPPQTPDAQNTELLPHGTIPGRAGGYGDFGPDSNYPLDEYEREGAYNEYDQPAAHSGNEYGEYDETGYEQAGYEQSGYEHGGYDEHRSGTGYDDEGYYDNAEYSNEDYDYDSAAAGYGPEGEYDAAYDKPKKRSIVIPVVFGVLGLALAAGAAVIGWQVLGKSSPTTSSAAAQSSAPATIGANSTSSSSDSTDTTTSAATSTPPEGSTRCRPTSSTEGTGYTRSAAGNSVTSCGFAEAVRKAYARAAESDSSSTPSSVVAISPTTGRSYTMSCTATGRLITCTGGDNAVVYVY